MQQELNSNESQLRILDNELTFDPVILIDNKRIFYIYHYTIKI